MGSIEITGRLRAVPWGPLKSRVDSGMFHGVHWTYDKKSQTQRFEERERDDALFVSFYSFTSRNTYFEGWTII
jgi:hypothetical protein